MAVLDLVDLQLTREPPRAIGVADAPEEHCGRVVLGPSNDVQHPVHPVAEVDVPVSRRTEHDGVALGLTLVGVAGLVLDAIIGFDFSDDMAFYFSVDLATEVLAKEFLSDS